MRKIKRNRLKCLKCHDVIESKYLHDFKYCKCENCFIDGGTTYIKYGYVQLSSVELMTEYQEQVFTEEEDES